MEVLPCIGFPACAERWDAFSGGGLVNAASSLRTEAYIISMPQHASSCHKTSLVQGPGDRKVVIRAKIYRIIRCAPFSGQIGRPEVVRADSNRCDILFRPA